MKEAVERLESKFKWPMICMFSVGLKDGNHFVAKLDEEPNKSAKGRKRSFTPKLQLY
jgi:hypothetical protein